MAKPISLSETAEITIMLAEGVKARSTSFLDTSIEFEDTAVLAHVEGDLFLSRLDDIDSDIVSTAFSTRETHNGVCNRCKEEQTVITFKVDSGQLMGFLSHPDTNDINVHTVLEQSSNYCEDCTTEVVELIRDRLVKGELSTDLTLRNL